MPPNLENNEGVGQGDDLEPNKTQWIKRKLFFKQGQGIKLNYIHYWSDQVKSPTEGSSAEEEESAANQPETGEGDHKDEVRSDTAIEVWYHPADISVVYAILEEERIIPFYAEESAWLKGRSESELQFVIKKLKRQRERQGQNLVNITARHIAQCFRSSADQEPH